MLAIFKVCWRNFVANIQKELAIRLAWYVDRYGEIPRVEQLKLLGGAAYGRKDENFDRIHALALEILEYFRSLD